MNKSMIVVADSTRARIFTWGSDDHSVLKELEDMVNPEGRLHDRDMSSDLPGKGAGVSGSCAHAYGSKTSPKKHQQLEFAKLIASFLDDARKANKLVKLLLIVAPEFLGDLRSQLSNESSKLIVYESPKNLAAHDMADIRKHIPKPSEYKNAS